MFYRVRQFVKAVTARITKEDLSFVKQHLNKTEIDLFLRLKAYEQRHCIDVARKLDEMTETDVEMIKLGLLHDIGKIKYPLHPIEKSVIVILDRLTGGHIKRYSKYKMIKCYYEHPRIGYEILKEVGNYDKEFLKLIKNHHSQEEKNSKLSLLQRADNLS